LGLQHAVVATSPKGLNKNQIQRARLFAGSPQARQKSNKCDAEAEDDIAKLYGIPSRRKAFTMHVDEADDDVLSIASTKSYEAGFVCSCFCFKLFFSNKTNFETMHLRKTSKTLGHICCQDEECEEPPPPAAPLKQCHKCYWDYGRATLVRLTPGGVEVGVASQGPNSRLLAKFADETVESDVPNIYFVNPELKSAVLKRPARAKKTKRPEGWEEEWDDINGEDEADNPDEFDELAVVDESKDEEKTDLEVRSKTLKPKQQDVVDVQAPATSATVAASAAAVPAAAKATAAKIYPSSYIKMWYKANCSYGIRQAFGDKKQVFTLRSPSKSMSQQELCEVADTVLLKLKSGTVSEAGAREWAMQQLH
jgi:hypothetical protein